MHHVIKTQVIDVATDNSNEAFNLQHKLSSLFYRVLIPILEKMFDELAPGEQVIYLGSIEVDLGMMTPEEMEKREWPEKFKEIVFRQLKEIVMLHNVKNLKPGIKTGITQQWLHYMQYGFLPWNTLRTDEEWYKKVLEEFAKNYYSIDLLRQLISKDARAVRRIVLLHDPEYLVHLMEVLTAKKQGVLVSILEALSEFILSKNKFAANPDYQKKWKRSVWEAIFLYAAVTSKNAGAEEIIDNVILKEFENKDLKLLLKQKNIPQQMLPFIPAIKKAIKNAITDKPKNHAENLQKEIVVTDIKSMIPEEGIFVKYAGLVILHPFLSLLFKRMNLIINGKFIDMAAQKKGIVLLHYAATGNTFFEEHELVVHKIMCGYALHDIVEPGIEINENEKRETDNLLDVVIAEWSILKNTTASGLRESFLQRNGKFVNTSSVDIKLMVEAHALDILLDHLPWALSIIRLPWMPQVLKVEWK
jgi:Contractile injection system tape measure protein